MSDRVCVLCDGHGCEECDGQGRRYREVWRSGDGVQIAVSGSGSFDPEQREAFEGLAAAAFARMDETSAPVQADADSSTAKTGGEAAHKPDLSGGRGTGG